MTCLKLVYEKSQGYDGRVSIEVDPRMARDDSNNCRSQGTALDR